MENFKRESNGYSTYQVDQFLQQLKQEHNNKIREHNEEMYTMAQRLNELKNSLDTYKEKDKLLSQALMTAVQKADEITTSAKTVYDLEIKRIQLLCKKWEIVLNNIKDKFSTLISSEEINNLIGDFQYALSVTLNSQLNQKGEELYSKSILAHIKPQASNPTLNNQEKKENNINPVINNDNKGMTLADLFLNGESVDMPDSYGQMGPNSLQIPTKEMMQNLKNNEFELASALQPEDSLKDILQAFDLSVDD